MPDDFTADQRRYILQFRHPEKMLAQLPGVSLDLVARMEELAPDRYRGIRREFQDHARAAARELLQLDGVAEAVGRLPFRAGDCVVGLGDSITDDLQSWFEILRSLLREQGVQDGPDFRNFGYSGDTSTHCICRFGEVVAAEPDWIIAMVGTNDARLHGKEPTKVLVSPDETARNLEMLANYGRTETNARWLWIAPPAGVLEDKIRSHWWLGELGLRWRSEDLEKINAIVREREESVVDVNQAFGLPPDPQFLLPDGLHPSLAGQKQIALAVVRSLSELNAPAVPHSSQNHDCPKHGNSG
jgi:acetyl esterase/acyl-CoA thioesterase-1